jgi:predicted Fe-Mo cluster-binding NifX family protein
MPADIVSPRSEHFGRAPAFALVELAGSVVVAVRAIQNRAEEAHGAAAALLVAQGVTDVVTVGIGQGMLSRLQAAGIRVWIDTEAVMVGDAVVNFAADRVRPVTEEDVRNHGGGHDGGEMPH